MRRSYAFAGVVLLAASAAVSAGDHAWLDRFVQRAPLPRIPPVHSAEQAGYPMSVSRLAVPSVTRFDQAGYVGGGSVRNNNLLARGPGSATGPLYAGTFATDYGGLRGHLGRVFLAPSDHPGRGIPISWNYRAEGPRVTDIFALRPFRKAVLEKREDAEDHHGSEKKAGGH